MCIPYILMDYLFHYEVSNIHQENLELNAHGRHDRGIYRILGYELGGFQVVLDVQSLDDFEIFLVHEFCFFCNYV